MYNPAMNRGTRQGVLTVAVGCCMFVFVIAACAREPSPRTPHKAMPPAESVGAVGDDAKPRPRDVVQPVRVEMAHVETPAEGDFSGVVGMDGRDLDGVLVEPPPPPSPSPAPPPLNVAPAALNALRVAGDTNIVPDDITKTEIGRYGKVRLVGSYKLCITAEGNIGQVSQLKSTGFPAYDSKITSTIRSEWRYRPFTVNGERTPVCTAITFIYRQLEPPPQKP